jgi:hypothetical protein
MGHPVYLRDYVVNGDVGHPPKLIRGVEIGERPICSQFFHGCPHSWIKYLALVEPRFRPNCGHPVTEFGECGYRLVLTNSQRRANTVRMRFI